MWKASNVNIQTLASHEQFIRCRVLERRSDSQMLVTIIYGQNNVNKRKDLWSSLDSLGSNIREPWCLVGDYNAVIDPGDRVNGARVTDAEMEDLRRCTSDLNLTKMRSCGKNFTWSNGHVSSKIDGVYCNADWMLNFGQVWDEFKEPGVSNHTPVVIKIRPAKGINKKLFRFVNVLVEQPGFLGVVQNTWSMEINGCVMFSIWQKLKACRVPLKALMAKQLGSIDLKLNNARSELAAV